MNIFPAGLAACRSGMEVARSQIAQPGVFRFDLVNRLFAFVARSYAVRLVDIDNKDFSVARFAGSSARNDRLYGTIDIVFGQDNVKAHFFQKLDFSFGPPVNFRIPFLGAMPFDMGDGNAGDAAFGQIVQYLFEF